MCALCFIFISSYHAKVELAMFLFSRKVSVTQGIQCLMKYFFGSSAILPIQTVIFLSHLGQKLRFYADLIFFLLNFLLWKSDRMENKYPNFVRLTTWNHPKWRQSRYIFITWWLYIYLISPCDFEFWSIIALVNEFFVAKYIEQYKLIRNACFLPQGPLSLIEIDMKIGTRTIITKRLQYNLTSNF